MDAQIEQLRYMSLDRLRQTWIRSFGEAPARWAAAATIEGIAEHQVIALLPERDRQHWTQLPLEDRPARLRDLVRRVTVRIDAVEIEVDVAALDASSLNSRSTSEHRDHNPTATKIPIRVRPRGGSKLVETQDGRNSHLATRPDRA
jgi:hypothetical protein